VRSGQILRCAQDAFAKEVRLLIAASDLGGCLLDWDIPSLKADLPALSQRGGGVSHSAICGWRSSTSFFLVDARTPRSAMDLGRVT
jgi:hypothetical protein